MTTELTAAEICRLLNLEPNATCGSVRVSFVSQQPIAAGGCQRRSRTGSHSAPRSTSGDARRAGAASPHPQRAALPLLSRRSARGVPAAQRRSSERVIIGPICAPVSACNS